MAKASIFEVLPQEPIKIELFLSQEIVDLLTASTRPTNAAGSSRLVAACERGPRRRDLGLPLRKELLWMVLDENGVDQLLFQTMKVVSQILSLFHYNYPLSNV